MDRPVRTPAFAEPEPLSDRAAVWADAFAAAPVIRRDTIGGHVLIVDDFEASGNMVRFWARIENADGVVVYEDDHFVVNPPANGGDVEDVVISVVGSAIA